jgi:hypothetical protein
VSELRTDVCNGCNLADEAVEEVVDGLTLPKMLPGKSIKVPASHIPQEKIQRKCHVVQRSPFHVENREWTGIQKGRLIALLPGLLLAAPLEGFESR